MNILMVTRFQAEQAGGVSTVSFELSRALSTLGASVTILSGISPGRTLLLPLAFGSKEYDIVHVHSSPYAALGRPGVTSVTTLHTTCATEFMFDAKMKYILGRLLENVTLRRTRGLLLVNEILVDELLSLYRRATKALLRRDLIEVIPSAVNCEVFKPVGPRDSHAKTLNLLALGRMTPVKGFHVLIDAMQEVGAKRSDIRLQIFGDGPERPQLESLVSRQPRCNTVLQPFVPRAKLVQTYSSADVFMLPSLYESQGLVLMEAMACGLPCIASDLPCFRGIVRDADNAVLVKPGDPAALAEKISWLADNRGMLRKLGANARATILELPTWREIAKRTLSAYEKFLRR